MDLDAVRIGAADPDALADAYAMLLGAAPSARAPGVRRFQLERGAIEVGDGPPGLHALTFVGAMPAVDFVGLDVRVAAEAPTPAPAIPGVAIDHVVVRSADPERAIALWRDRLGLRLALDREFPARGLRLLFFRTNHITLEYATPLPRPDGPAGPDQLWGVSYRVADLDAQRTRLLAAGVDVSEIRTGMRPGTRVASIRSGVGDVPTLMLEVSPT
jgi:catechol 2,3-dioxygenase-like lactoylglutathione lyase family enzyme